MNSSWDETLFVLDMMDEDGLANVFQSIDGEDNAEVNEYGNEENFISMTVPCDNQDAYPMFLNEDEISPILNGKEGETLCSLTTGNDPHSLGDHSDANVEFCSVNPYMALPYAVNQPGMAIVCDSDTRVDLSQIDLDLSVPIPSQTPEIQNQPSGSRRGRKSNASKGLAVAKEEKKKSKKWQSSDTTDKTVRNAYLARQNRLKKKQELDGLKNERDHLLESNKSLTLKLEIVSKELQVVTLERDSERRIKEECLSKLKIIQQTSCPPGPPSTVDNMQTLDLPHFSGTSAIFPDLNDGINMDGAAQIVRLT